MKRGQKELGLAAQRTRAQAPVSVGTGMTGSAVAFKGPLQDS